MTAFGINDILKCRKRYPVLIVSFSNPAVEERGWRREQPRSQKPESNFIYFYFFVEHSCTLAEGSCGAQEIRRHSSSRHAKEPAKMRRRKLRRSKKSRRHYSSGHAEAGVGNYFYFFPPPTPTPTPRGPNEKQNTSRRAGPKV